MFWMVLFFTLGYGLSYGRQYINKLGEDIDNTSIPEVEENTDMSVAHPLVHTHGSTLDFDGICDVLDNTTGGEWYIEETSDAWYLKASHLDGGVPYYLISVRKQGNSPDGWPRKEDAEFIVEARNIYIPELLEEIERLGTEKESLHAFIEVSMLEAHHTVNDYKKILNDVLKSL